MDKATINPVEIMTVLSRRGITFSLTEATKIVGGRGRLNNLIAAGKIGCAGGTSANSRVAVNAWDCLLYARLRTYTCDMRKKRWRKENKQQ